MAEDEQPRRTRIDLPDDDDALLAECDVDTFRSGGPGGQHQNTTDSGVRLRHRPSGLSVECRESRSQHHNRQRCLEKLRNRVERLNRPPRKRRKTRPSKAARERRMQRKKQRGHLKKLRQRPPNDG